MKMGDITYFLRIISYRKLHTAPTLTKKCSQKNIKKPEAGLATCAMQCNAINYYDRIRLVFFVWRFLDS